ncbi:hypothetical protein MNBD_GAMMA26-892 [hydrothermal vent metagenome]|uniref:Uncharacterized protein n=1 Tax=hydrothermal vent metagenome TaxID=652676 RepID=A0A3B1BL05_9ZZZZ
MATLRLTITSMVLGITLSTTGWAEWNAPGGEKDDAMKLTPDLANGLDLYEMCSVCHTAEA